MTKNQSTSNPQNGTADSASMQNGNATKNYHNDKSKWTIRDTPQDTGLLPTLAVTLWLGWMGAMFYLALYLTFFASSTGRAVMLGMFSASLLLPRHFPGKSLGSRIGGWICLHASRYFGLVTIIEDMDAIRAYSSNGKDEKKRDQAVIFAVEPHDILPYGIFAFNPHLQLIPESNISRTCGALMTSAVFYVPFMRQIYSWVGGAPVDRKTFHSRLDKAQSFAFVPGGVQEVTMMDPKCPDDILMFLKTRKGFVKMAMLHGSPIVPVFIFHLDGSYDAWIPRGKLISKVARAAGFLPMVFTGRFGIPFGIPKPRKLQVVVGKPIEVPKVEEGEIQREDVEKYHSRFIQEMVALYDRHKEEHGYGHRKLLVV